jgi:hypothetical protein
MNIRSITKFFKLNPANNARHYSLDLKDIPKKHHAINLLIKSKDYELNTQEMTGPIYRIMQTAELRNWISAGVVGTLGPDTRMTITSKYNHLEVPEHILENNSSCLLAFTECPQTAVKIAGNIGSRFLPNCYALVQSNLPPVCMIPSLHLLLDPESFEAHYAYLCDQKKAEAYSTVSVYNPPYDPFLLVNEEYELCQVSSNLSCSSDFRPKVETMFRVVNYFYSAMMNYKFFDQFQCSQVKQRDWAIEIACTGKEENNNAKLFAKARDAGIIPPGGRPITVDDAAALFLYFSELFPADILNNNQTIHRLKYVPEEFPIASPQAVKFLINEHSLFRDRRNRSITTAAPLDYFDINYYSTLYNPNRS